jgi:hypothetical protein
MPEWRRAELGLIVAAAPWADVIAGIPCRRCQRWNAGSRFTLSPGNELTRPCNDIQTHQDGLRRRDFTSPGSCPAGGGTIVLRKLRDFRHHRHCAGSQSLSIARQQRPIRPGYKRPGRHVQQRDGWTIRPEAARARRPAAGPETGSDRSRERARGFPAHQEHLQGLLTESHLRDPPPFSFAAPEQQRCSMPRGNCQDRRWTWEAVGASSGADRSSPGR